MDEQEEMVRKFSKELGGRIPGVKAIIGEAPDYIELAFRHFDKTGERLFGKRYNSDYTRTKTPTMGFDVALVGNFHDEFGLSFASRHRDSINIHLWVSPLIVLS